MSAPDPQVWRLAWRISQNRATPFWLGTALFVAFFAFPVVTGLLVAEGFDALVAEDTGRAVRFAGAVLVAELVRILVLWYGVIWFIRSWEMMQALMRANMLHAQMVSGGDDRGRPADNAGEAVSVFRDDPEDVADFVDSWIDVSGGLAFTVIAFVVLGAVSPVATAVILLPMAAVALIVRTLDTRIKQYRVDDRRATVAFTGALGDVFTAVPSIRLADAAEPVTDHLAGLADRRRNTGVRDRVLEEGLQTAANGFAETALGLVLLVAAGAIASGELSAANLSLFVVLLGPLAFLPRMIGRLLARRKQSLVAFDNMAGLVAEGQSDRVARPRSLPIGHGEVVPVDIPTATRDRLERLDVVGLRIHSDGFDAPLVDGLDLVIEPGSITVVTGPVGSGKSTLLRAVLGLLHDRDGAVQVDGEVRWNGRVVDDRAAFFVPPIAAYLPQVPHLLSDSLADNVLLGRDGDLAAALVATELADDVAAMAEGTDTVVGPRGLRLSGGQRQRVAAARALVSRPELLVMDDLSSALDVETEQRLWSNLRASGTTVLAVSHRPLAIDLADQVVDLGRPIAAGSQ